MPGGGSFSRAARQRPGRDDLARVDARLVDRRARSTRTARPCRSSAARRRGGPRRAGRSRRAASSVAVEDRRLQRRQQQAPLAVVALAPLAAQEREAARGVVAVGAEALLAVAVGHAGRAERLEPRAQRLDLLVGGRRPSARPRSGCRAGGRVRSLCRGAPPTGSRARASAAAQRASRGRRRGTLSHWRVVAWRSFRPA